MNAETPDGSKLIGVGATTFNFGGPSGLGRFRFLSEIFFRIRIRRVPADRSRTVL